MNKVMLKSITPEIEKTIVEIARVSSSRENKSEQIEGLINYLIKNKHWSPFEHGFMTMEIKTSKAIGIQLLRHRSFTFQEFSQRYAEVENLENIEFRLQAETNRQSSTITLADINFDVNGSGKSTLEFHQGTPEMFAWVKDVHLNMDKTMQLYKQGIKMGIAKECARMILPLTTETTIYMTGSIRSWIHLIMIRNDTHAQKEIQIIAMEMKKIFKEELPLISKALEY